MARYRKTDPDPKRRHDRRRKLKPETRKGFKKATHVRGSGPYGGLNHKQLIFVEEYARHSNGTAAAQAAGYKPGTAPAQSKHLLRLPKIQEAIERVKGRLRREVEFAGSITKETLIEHLADIARVDLGAIMSWGGGAASLYDSAKLDPRVRRAISGVTVGKSGVAVKTESRIRAIELIADLLGYRTSKHEISGPGGTQPVQLYLPDNGRKPRPVPSPEDVHDSEPDPDPAEDENE